MFAEWKKPNNNLIADLQYFGILCPEKWFAAKLVISLNE